MIEKLKDRVQFNRFDEGLWGVGIVIGQDENHDFVLEFALLVGIVTIFLKERR